MELSKSDVPEILIVAAEASSALYAQRLLEHWQASGVRVRAYGVGSNQMEALGFERFGAAEDMAVVGLLEVLKHLKNIRAVFDRLLAEVDKKKPKFALLLDYPDFNLRLARELKKRGVTVIYYISPQIWAWRKSRIHTIKEVVDKMLVVLPFEKEFYAKHGVAVEFVGHPLLDEISADLFKPEIRDWERNRYGIRPEHCLVGLMPGSRKSEIAKHLNVQLAVAEKLYHENQSLRFALLVAPSFGLEEFQRFLPTYSFPLILLKDDPLKMVALTDVVLCASGTATLTVALMQKPMVVMYIMNWLSARLAKWFVRGMNAFGLVNLVHGKAVVPELFQDEASVDRLSQAVGSFANDAEKRQAVSRELAKTEGILGSRGATKRVAAILQKYLAG